MAETFFIADTHFFDYRMLNSPFNRQFQNIDKMNEKLVEDWNSKVGANDRVILIGDVAREAPVMSVVSMLNQLQGRKELCVGNHDEYLFHSSFKYAFDQIHYGLLTLGFGSPIQHVECFHQPLEVWNSYSAAKNEWHLHGHTHGYIRQLPFRFDVGADNIHRLTDHWGPLSYDEVDGIIPRA